jgi:hypothetical protein
VSGGPTAAGRLGRLLTSSPSGAGRPQAAYCEARGPWCRPGRGARIGSERVRVSGDVGRLSTAAQGKPVLRGLRKAIPRLLGCRCVEDEIVAEEEAVAGPGGPRSRPSRGATVTSTSTSMFSVTFTSIPSLSLLQLTWLLRISSVRLELGMRRAHGVSQSDHKKIARVSSMAAKVPLGDRRILAVNATVRVRSVRSVS